LKDLEVSFKSLSAVHKDRRSQFPADSAYVDVFTVKFVIYVMKMMHL
jgi:hypothetical protein